MIRPKYVRKKATGALWVSHVDGVWKKVDLGLKFCNTQPVGYVTTQFNPFNARNLRRFEVVHTC